MFQYGHTRPRFSDIAQQGHSAFTCNVDSNLSDSNPGTEPTKGDVAELSAAEEKEARLDGQRGVDGVVQLQQRRRRREEQWR